MARRPTADPAESRENAGGRAPLRTWVLTAGTFAVGTDAFVVAGVLPEIARSLDVSIGQAGQLVTVFSVAYVVLSPLLAALTGNWPRRRVLLSALGVFVLGNIATALAPSYALVLATRVVAAAGAVLFTPTAGATAAALAGPARRARAISLVTLGLATSSALGAPLGTLLGTALTWRETMWFVAGLGALAAVGVARWLPEVTPPPAFGLRQRLAPLRDRRVATILIATVGLFVGVYLFYTYQSVILAPATGSDGSALAVLLFVSGCAGTVGNLLAGAWVDRFGARRVVGAVALVAAANLALMPLTTATFPAAVVATAAYGVTVWSFNVPQQHRLIETVPSAAAMVVSLNASAMYLAVSLSGILGGVVLRVVTPSVLPVVAAGFVLCGLAASESVARLGRQAP